MVLQVCILSLQLRHLNQIDAGHFSYVMRASHLVSSLSKNLKTLNCFELETEAVAPYGIHHLRVGSSLSSSIE